MSTDATQLPLPGPFESMMEKAIKGELTPEQFLLVLLQKQAELQASLGQPTRNPVTRMPDVSIKENALALIVEAVEIMAEVNWKTWKQSPAQIHEIDRHKLLLEVVDAFQFIANIVNEAGFTAQDIASGYAEKLTINYQRLAAVKKANADLGG